MVLLFPSNHRTISEYWREVAPSDVISETRNQFPVLNRQKAQTALLPDQNMKPNKVNSQCLQIVLSAVLQH